MKCVAGKSVNAYKSAVLINQPVATGARDPHQLADELCIQSGIN